jgi:hypothetical protein
MSTQLTKRALFSKGALSAGVGLGTLALFQQHASADTPFTAFAFAATGAPTPRTMPDRLADVVNVKDYGALGNGSHDDSANIQAAFDAAFGPGNAPHGSRTYAPHGLNSYLNRAVYFPAGRYKCNNLLLTQVYGGRIYGAGNQATSLIYNGSTPTGTQIGPILSTNGFAYSSIENMDLDFGGTVKNNVNHTISVDLNWDGSGSVGLNNCALINLLVGSANYGIRIAASGNDGRAISLISVSASSCYYGISQHSDDCLVNSVGGGSSDCIYGAWIKKGYFNANGFMGAGAGQTDILHNSTGITTFIGTRSESGKCVYATAGKVVLIGVQHQLVSANNYTVNGENGAEVSLTSCYLGNEGSPNLGLMTGNVTLSLRNIRWGEMNENHFSNFTGTVANFQSTYPFTFATLPPNPADGLMVSISDADLTFPSTRNWGDPISRGGSTSHALLRWNGTNWTLVGK